MTLAVRLVVPEGEIWAGPADRVIAKTLDGDIGVLAGHSPVLGVLASASIVRILPEAGGWIEAAVAGGFLSVADDKVSILARGAVLGADVDVAAVREALGAAIVSGEGEDSEQVRYARARLRAAGDEA